eukprot:360762-Chlamydomonas_euryale.AAC.8
MCCPRSAPQRGRLAAGSTDKGARAVRPAARQAHGDSGTALPALLQHRNNHAKLCAIWRRNLQRRDPRPPTPTALEGRGGKQWGSGGGSQRAATSTHDGCWAARQHGTCTRARCPQVRELDGSLALASPENRVGMRFLTRAGRRGRST